MLKLAYFSPLNPQPSGISDYSEELLPHLSEFADITLFVDGFKPTNPEILEQFPICDYQKQPAVLNSLDHFDAVIYHMGNDHRYHAGIHDTIKRHPGIVVFHDFALQDFFLGLSRERKDPSIYFNETLACHGLEASRQAEKALNQGRPPAAVEQPTEYPLNCRLAQCAAGIVVHSEWSRSRLERIAPGVPLRRIAMPIKVPSRIGRGPEAVKLKLASFGLINPGKGIDQILRVLASLKNEYDFQYLLVGAENSYFDVRSLISTYGLKDHVSITGHVTMDEFEAHIASTDIALNLRERTVGESSASLCRIMAAGVPVIVSNVGSFSELPGDVVVKLDHDRFSDTLLQAFLRRLMEDKQLRQRIGSNAREYILAEHDLRTNALRYVDFITEVVQTRLRHQLVSDVTRELSLMGVTHNDAPMLQSVATDIAILAPSKAFSSTNGKEIGSASQPSDTVEQLDPLLTDENGSANRLTKISGIDYKRAAVEYPKKLDPERFHYLFTKPFYNLANKPVKHLGEGMDAETFRHFCDFANMAVAMALPAGARILDVGCGSGWLSEYFARLGYDVTGIDISPDLIDIASKRLADQTYKVDHEKQLRCRFMVHDIELGALPETFDAVVCYDSLHHFEDEHAVMRNLAAMTSYGGIVFILEGERPEEGSATEDELVEVMRRYETLESPFTRSYLRALFEENGLAVIGDYVSINGLFERDNLNFTPAEMNYLLCKKVVRLPGQLASSVQTSRQSAGLGAEITIQSFPLQIAPGTEIETQLHITNVSPTLWLVGPAERHGSVMLGLRLFDEAGALIWERHGTPPLPYALAEGESVTLKLQFNVPFTPGTYKLKLDMVAQHVCWFEDSGSKPTEISFNVTH